MTPAEQRAARFIAAERGAFEMENESPSVGPPDAGPATAAMYEFAAEHDGQDAEAWLRFFTAKFRQ